MTHRCVVCDAEMLVVIPAANVAQFALFKCPENHVYRIDYGGGCFIDTYPRRQRDSYDRYWINAPSALQSAHRLHGLRVLAPSKIGAVEKTVTVYFTDPGNDQHSADIEPMFLSSGWPSRYQPATPPRGDEKAKLAVAMGLLVKWWRANSSLPEFQHIVRSPLAETEEFLKDNNVDSFDYVTGYRQLLDVIRSIASCDPICKGDVVDIAQQALKQLQQ